MPFDFRIVDVGANAAPEADWASVAAAAAAAADTPPSADAPLPEESRRMIVYRSGLPVARVGFGARAGFSGAQGVTGYVGWYAVTDADAGTCALDRAATALLDEGAERVVGPLDGSTWYRYRAAVPREKEIESGEPFLSEPRNPPDWPAHFDAAGFQPELEYETRLVAHPRRDLELEPRRAELTVAGVLIRPLELAEYERELRLLYDLSVDAFAANPYYSPISFAEFQGLYAGLRPLLDPALVRLAIGADGRLLGYVFAFPDLIASPGNPRIVLKTLATHRDVRGMGLGGILVDEIHAIAENRGAAVLHALMQTSNVSRNISSKSSSVLFRRYVLYGRERS
jgi:GNAT superfamily N-acetyltransferase